MSESVTPKKKATPKKAAPKTIQELKGDWVAYHAQFKK